jgi:hypothetical protein
MATPSPCVALSSWASGRRALRRRAISRRSRPFGSARSPVCCCRPEVPSGSRISRAAGSSGSIRRGTSSRAGSPSEHAPSGWRTAPGACGSRTDCSTDWRGSTHGAPASPARSRSAWTRMESHSGRQRLGHERSRRHGAANQPAHEPRREEDQGRYHAERGRLRVRRGVDCRPAVVAVALARDARRRSSRLPTIVPRRGGDPDGSDGPAVGLCAATCA